jgi:predicted Zn-dependent protease
MAFEEGDVEQAQMLVQSLDGKSDEFPALRMLRGMIYARQGQTHTAISEFERFFRLGGENTAARVALAEQYAKTGADKKGWEILNPVLSRANAKAATLQLGAKLAGNLGNPEQAALASRAQSAQSGVPYGKQLAEAGDAIRAGKWDKADSIYQKVLTAGGDRDPVVLNNAANIRLEKGDKAGAISLARKALALAPSDPIIMDTLGWSLVQVDPASAEGRGLIARAMELAPNNKEISNHWMAVSRRS